MGVLSSTHLLVRAFELSEKGVEVLPVLVGQGEFAMLACENVLCAVSIEFR
jgi:hypothetical protein